MADPNLGDLVQRPGTDIKLGWNRGGVTQKHKRRAISPKRCKIGPKLLRRTNRKLHTRFRLAPKLMTLDDYIISVTGKATDVKFGRHIHKVDLNKIPLKFWRKWSVGVTTNCPNFFKYPYYLRNG